MDEHRCAWLPVGLPSEGESVHFWSREKMDEPSLLVPHWSKVLLSDRRLRKKGGHVRLGKNTNNEAVTHIHSTT